MNSSLKSVIKCAKWLSDFLRKRSIAAADQRPLYAYHCSAEEYRELRSLLLELGNFDSGSKDASACACFSLFCSEWYRREYHRDHGWSWDPIWQVLGYSLNPIELRKAVPKGLEGYWKRPVRVYDSERRNFLGSLFGEGGLPFQMLKESDSRFQSLFFSILKTYNQSRMLGFSTSQQVEKLLERVGLPQAFSESSSIELIAGMADELVSLVSLYDLHGTSEPVTKLDSISPQWRELFPLPLDQSTGTDLLNGLLKRASTETGKVRRKGGGCQHFWEESSDRLKLELSMPEAIIFNLGSQPATTRFDLILREGDRELAALGPGYAVIENGIANVRIRRRDVVVWRNRYDAPLSLVAMAGGLVLASVAVENSLVALGEIPVGFAFINDRWQLCGQASFNTRSEKVLLVMPKGALPVPEDIQPESGPTICSFPSLMLLGVQELRIEGEDVFRIRIGDSQDSTLQPEFVGASLEWQTKPESTFLGMPRVRWPEKNGQDTDTDTDTDMDVEVFVAGKLLSMCSLPELFGVQYLSVRNKTGDTLVRRWLGVLPPDLRIELKRGVQPDQGSVLVYTEHNCLIHAKGVGVLSKKIKYDDHIELQLDAQGMPPAKLELHITPNLLGGEVVIELPFPSSGCMAFSAEGKPLKHEVSIDNLLGTRLHLFGKSGSPTRFGLELSLRGSLAKQAYYQWSYIAGKKPVEISLFSIREKVLDLFSLQSGIDQVVELRAYGGGHEAVYWIRKYETEIRLNADRNLLSAANLNDADAAHPQPTLMLLHEPARKTQLLIVRLSEGVPTGEYELPSSIDREGPWLVVPRKDSLVSFRPLFVPGNWSAPIQGEEIQSLQKAVLAFDPRAQACVFMPVFNAMSANPMHSGWQFLRTLYDQFGYLPLGTFEVWKALISHPSAMAMALFKFDMDAAFIGRIETEFPMLWEIFPIADLHLAGQRFGAFLKIKGVPAEVLGRMLSRLGEAVPSFGENIQHYLANKLPGLDAQLPLALLKTTVHDSYYQELMRERAEAEWPEFKGVELQHWCLAQPDCVIDFQPEMSYRNTVVYLPAFMAAVASGAAQMTDIFDDYANSIFFLRQIRDLDARWFSSVYQISLLRNLLNLNKDL